jgi:hypothetical protein
VIEVIHCKRWAQAKTTHKHVSLPSGLLTTPVRPGSRVLPTDRVAGRVDIRELAPVFRDFMQALPMSGSRRPIHTGGAVCHGALMSSSALRLIGSLS